MAPRTSPDSDASVVPSTYCIAMNATPRSMPASKIGTDPRVVELRRDRRLAPEATEERFGRRAERAQHFECDVASESGVLGEVDDRLAAATDLTDRSIRPDRLERVPCGQRSVCGGSKPLARTSANRRRIVGACSGWASHSASIASAWKRSMRSRHSATTSDVSSLARRLVAIHLATFERSPGLDSTGSPEFRATAEADGIAARVVIAGNPRKPRRAARLDRAVSSPTDERPGGRTTSPSTLPAVRAYIRLRMGARVRRWETESDIAQSVCREALAGIDRLEYRGPAELRQWLFQAALRKIVEKDRFLRAEKRDVDLVRTNAVRDGDDESIREVCRSLAGPSQIAIGREALERIEVRARRHGRGRARSGASVAARRAIDGGDRRGVGSDRGRDPRRSDPRTREARGEARRMIVGDSGQNPGHTAMSSNQAEPSPAQNWIHAMLSSKPSVGAVTVA